MSNKEVVQKTKQFKAEMRKLKLLFVTDIQEVMERKIRVNDKRYNRYYYL